MNSVLFWNSVLLEASRRDFTRGYFGGQQPGPIRTAWAMAIVHLAIHDAVAFRTKAAAAYLNKKKVTHNVPALTGPVDDIVAGAAFTTLNYLYPAYTALLEEAVGNLGKVDAAAFAGGVTVAEAILKHRSGDGSTTTLTGPQPVQPRYGQHRGDPCTPNQPRLGPVWGNVTRFTGPDHQPLKPFPGQGSSPNGFLADPNYQADFEEVRDHGASQRRARTATEERIAVYWGYDGANGLGVPPRLYNQLARAIVGKQASALTLGRTAELFAVLNVALADAGIDAWHWKYVYDLWRPVVAIRRESGPEGDPFWVPLGMPQTNGTRGTLTPPFPAYPSGHATFGAALMQTLRLGLKTAPTPITLRDVLDVENGISRPLPSETFTFVSDELDGGAIDPDGSVRTPTPVTFSNFPSVVWENSVSRIYLGVHWRFDGLPRSARDDKVGGVPLGLAVGKEAHDFFITAPSLGGTV